MGPGAALESWYGSIGYVTVSVGLQECGDYSLSTTHAPPCRLAMKRIQPKALLQSLGRFTAYPLDRKYQT